MSVLQQSLANPPTDSHWLTHSLKVKVNVKVNVIRITTDSQSASLSRCQAPIWDPRPIFSYFFPYCQLRVPWCEVPSLTRGWICNLLAQLLLGLARAVTLGSGSRRTHDHFLLPHLRLPPNLEGQVPVFVSPRNRVAQLYLRALGSLFVAIYLSWL
jgi:hypothetical protein